MYFTEMDPNQLESAYQEYAKKVHGLPDGIIQVNIHFLNELGILTTKPSTPEEGRRFEDKYSVIESSEKVTLHNEQFAIWIVPQTHTTPSRTLTMVAEINEGKPNLEFAFLANGVYNTPKIILRALQSKIEDMIDTENSLSSYEEGA